MERPPPTVPLLPQLAPQLQGQQGTAAQPRHSPCHWAPSRAMLLAGPQLSPLSLPAPPLLPPAAAGRALGAASPPGCGFTQTQTRSYRPGSAGSPAGWGALPVLPQARAGLREGEIRAWFGEGEQRLTARCHRRGAGALLSVSLCQTPRRELPPSCHPARPTAAGRAGGDGMNDSRTLRGGPWPQLPRRGGRDAGRRAARGSSEPSRCSPHRGGFPAPYGFPSGLDLLPGAWGWSRQRGLLRLRVLLRDGSSFPFPFGETQRWWEPDGEQKPEPRQPLGSAGGAQEPPPGPCTGWRARAALGDRGTLGSGGMCHLWTCPHQPERFGRPQRITPKAQLVGTAGQTERRRDNTIFI